jgi:hypothetical protein
MIKTYLSLLLFALTSIDSGAQITNSVYLDYSSLWHFHGAGWNGIYGYETFTTTYIDGDTTVNGQDYYKQYRYVHTITNSTPVSETYQLYGPSLLREDTDHNFVYYYNGSESMFLFNDSIAGSNIGDPFPALGANCNVENIVYLTIGGQTVKHVYGTVNNMTAAGIAEGIGYIGPTCGLGVEGNENMVCYYRSGDSVCFQNGFDYNDFPEPQYMNVGTEELDDSGITIYPNPVSDQLVIEQLHGENLVTWLCFDATGKLVADGTTEKKSIINVSTWKAGIYFLQLIEGEGKVTVRKIAVN